MKCPHCAVEIHPAFNQAQIAAFDHVKLNDFISQRQMTWIAAIQRCPAFTEDIIYLKPIIMGMGTAPELMAYPQSSALG
jgi:hypothetical protein